MDITLEQLGSLLGYGQLGVGVIALIGVVVYLQVTGRLRRALEFPPLVANRLDGGHLLTVLIVFLLLLQALAYGTGLLGYGSAADGPAAATAPTSQAAAPDEGSTTQAVQQAEGDPARLLGQGLAEVLVIGLMLYIAQGVFAGGVRGLGLRGDRLGWDFGWAVVAYLAFWPICFAVAELSTLVYQLVVTEPPSEHQVLTLLESPGLSVGWQVMAWGLAGLVAPLFEEIFFRGLLVNWLRQAGRSTWLAIIASGVAFGIIHMPQWHLVPALSLLGILAGYLYVRTGSLTLVILMHAVFNTRTLVMLKLAGGI